MIREQQKMSAFTVLVTARLLGGLVAIGLLGCSDHKTGPVENHYYLYGGIHRSLATGWVAVIDCDTDLLIDSLTTAGMGGTVMVTASPDGKYVVAMPWGQPRVIWSGATHLQVANPLQAGERPVFFPDRNEALTWDYENVRIYHLPDFDLDTTLPIDLYLPKRIPNTDTVIAIDQRGPHSAPTDLSMITFLDLNERRLVDSFVINPDEHDVGYQIAEYDLSPDGRRLYALGARGGGGASLLCYDLRLRQIVFRRDVLIPNGYCRVSPDGHEVWYTDPGTDHPDFNQWPGLIVILDAETGVTLDTIKTEGYYADSTKPLFVQDIRFVPNASKAYINCGTFLRGPQPVLVINTDTHRIDHALYTDFSRLMEFIDMGPAP